VQGLIESMAGRVPTIVIDLVTRLSAGSPFMASAVLRGLVESGALFHDGVAWRTDNVLMNDVRSSREAATFLARRLDLLDAELLGLLAAGAVLGKEFDLDLAAGLVEADTGEVLAALQSLRSRHLVWLDADGLRATFVHDKLREALLDRLSPEQRQRLHARAAELLEGGGSSYDLAYHFHAAGDDRAALPYALAAAEEARSRHALAAAEQQFRIAVGGIDPADIAAMRDVQTGLGDVLMLRGRYDEAAACFRAAFAAAQPGAERAQIALRLGELTFKRGEAVESVEHLQSALRSLHRWVPRSRGRFLLGALWEALVQAVHTLTPTRLRRRQRTPTGVDLLAARIYSRLAYSYWFTRGAIPCGWAHLREMNLMERFPATLELAQAYSEHAPVASTLPWYSRGRAYAQRSLEIRRQFGDVWGQGQSLHFYGVVLYSGSRFEESIQKLTEAIRLLERTGDQWEINTALWHVGFANYRLGRTDEAIATFQRCLANGREIGDFQAAAIAMSGISKASNGNVPAADVAELLDRCVGDLHTTGELAAGEAVRLLAAGEPEAAVELLADVRRRIRRAGVRNEYVAPVLPWLLTALRTVAETCAPYDAGHRRRVLRRAWLVGWRARSIATFFRNNLAHVLREQAAVALLSSRRRAAAHLLRKARKVATKLGMTADLVQISAVDDLLASPASRSTSMVASPPVERTLSLVDRFDTLLRVGRAIASALTPDAIFSVVSTAARDLLRAEACDVVLVDDESTPVEASASDALVREAVAARRVVVLADDDPSVSMIIGRAKSALAAPIFVRGRLVACWVVVHREITDLFGEDERRLADFISALAGAALENADGFAEVQALTQSLERRVDDRTAELLVANTALRATLDELEHANDELRRLDELKSDFVAMVSHELRSPLTSVIGYCSTMLRHWDRVDDEKKHSFVEIIDAQSRRLSVLVNDLLEMSRIESGHLDTELTSLPLQAILDELTRDYADRASDLHITGDTDVEVVADIEHLRRVLINLIDNALKYGAEPITVAVSAEDFVTIAVRDRGDGVPDEFIPRLFDKFAQASIGSTRRASGTGLGLSIVKGLVEAMNGDVRYEPPTPDLDGGFVVQLPRSA
jgi:signal transduction histidine kinase/Tfp pilus assembly protein PilF